jgi:HlyD family secretion protein
MLIIKKVRDKMDQAHSVKPELETPDIQDLFQPEENKSVKKYILVAGLILVAIVLFATIARPSAGPAPSAFNTKPVTKGELIVKVSATGNLQPTNQVEIGSELSGNVSQVLVDVNDRVKKGQILAKLDTSKLEDTVIKSNATLAAAKAKVLQAEATVEEDEITLKRYQKVSELSGGKVPSQSEMDTAKANLKRAEADLASAQAEVFQAEAGLKSNETDLSKATIRSPINGIVLSREIEPGQTVAASYQAPVLFTLAEDLSRMELQVDVDEADVGRVKEGQTASFTVDAWPDRTYSATITRVEYGAQEEDGVISYLTILSVDNQDLSLRPGMTGTADIKTLHRKNALLVPNAALRFSPPSNENKQESAESSFLSSLMPHPPAPPAKRKTISGNGNNRVWILENGIPVEVSVKAGATDGRMTEILDSSLDENTKVITEIFEVKS